MDIQDEKNIDKRINSDEFYKDFLKIINDDNFFKSSTYIVDINLKNVKNNDKTIDVLFENFIKSKTSLGFLKKHIEMVLIVHNVDILNMHKNLAILNAMFEIQKNILNYIEKTSSQVYISEYNVFEKIIHFLSKFLNKISSTFNYTKRIKITDSFGLTFGLVDRIKYESVKLFRKCRECLAINVLCDYDSYKIISTHPTFRPVLDSNNINRHVYLVGYLNSMEIYTSELITEKNCIYLMPSIKNNIENIELFIDKNFIIEQTEEDMGEKIVQNFITRYFIKYPQQSIFRKFLYKGKK